MKKKIFNIDNLVDENSQRIDKYLQSQLSTTSRTKVKNLIVGGNVRLNNNKIFEASKKIKNGDEIEINFPPPEETLIKPNKMFLDILYDDDDIVVINKSPGVVVHPGAGNYEKTIVNGL